MGSCPVQTFPPGPTAALRARPDGPLAASSAQPIGTGSGSAFASGSATGDRLYHSSFDGVLRATRLASFSEKREFALRTKRGIRLSRDFASRGFAEGGRAAGASEFDAPDDDRARKEARAEEGIGRAEVSDAVDESVHVQPWGSPGQKNHLNLPTRTKGSRG